MTDFLYTDETVTVYFEMWDGEVSPEKPESRPDDAWLAAEDVAEITLTITKPNDAADEVKTLTDDEIEPSGRAGEWRARFNTDAGEGAYFATFEGDTIDDYRAVSSVRVSARPRP